MSNTREAFATRRYTDIGAIFYDLACLAIESSGGVNPFRLEVRNGTVVNPDLGERDMRTYCCGTTELDRQEMAAGMAIREALLIQPEGIVVVWISPPGGPLAYKEGRIVIGESKREGDIKVMDSFGICTDFTPNQCLEIARRLTTPNQEVLQDSEQLRSTVFILDNLANPWEFLRKIIPLDEVWDNIVSGEAEKAKQKALKDAKQMALVVWPYFKNAVGLWEQVVVGAYLEGLMMGLGYGIVGGVCGILNSEILTNIFGQATGISSEFGKYVKKCGQCMRNINKVIPKGYRCECGGVYEGC